MINKRLKRASESELKKLMFRIKRVYALWMIENIVKENPWCIGLPQFVNLSFQELRNIYPTMECWGIKDTDRWVEMEKGYILLKISSWKNKNKELRDKEFPYYISGVMTEKSYLVFAFDKDKLVIRAFYVDLDSLPHTFNLDMINELEYLKREMDSYEMDAMDLFTEEDSKGMDLN